MTRMLNPKMLTVNVLQREIMGDLAIHDGGFTRTRQESNNISGENYSKSSVFHK